MRAQRRYEQNMMAQGRCRVCGKKCSKRSGVFCPAHLKRHYENAKARLEMAKALRKASA